MFKVYSYDEKCLPGTAKPGDAGIDLRAAEAVTLKHNTPTLVKCGIHLEISPGCFGMVVPRSGLATKHGITLTNTVGIIDSGYRGEIMCSLLFISRGCKPSYRINKYDRIAQLITMPMLSRKDNSPLYITVGCLSDLSETERGEGGFGSTGQT